MPLVVSCPSCGKKLKVPDNLIGKPVRCADCAGTFTAESPAAAPPPSSRVPASAPRPPADDMDDDDDRPGPRSRGGRRDPNANYAPHRGGMILAFGIISLASLAFLPVLLGLPMGIVAWILGGRDMKAMAAGRMDPEGRSMTQIGFILGIVGTVINTLILVGTCLYILVVVVIIGLFAGTVASMPTGAKVPPPNFNNPPRKKIQLGKPMRLADYLPTGLRNPRIDR
jgi:hypothetical protein